MVRLRLPAWAAALGLVFLSGCYGGWPCCCPADPCCGCMGGQPCCEGPILSSGVPMIAAPIPGPGCGCDRGVAPIPAPRQPYVQPLPPEGAVPPLATTPVPPPPQAQPTPFTPNGNGNGNGVR
jgi:hypothetical protein